MNGILNIDKPQDTTSYNIVALVKRLSRERRVGHGGTLDPQATGVLPVFLGQATRMVEFLFEHRKTYRARIELGTTTDTYDAWGKVIERKDASGVTREKVLSALAGFRGLIQQTPPMFSAIKQHGKPLYKLARAGISVERESREAMVYSIDLVDWQHPEFTLDVVCGKGTYIRSLAQDLGQVLDCGAILKGLIRLRYGPFEIANALSVPQLEEAFRYGYWTSFLYPMDYVLQDYTAVVVGDEAARAVINGNLLDLSTFQIPEPKKNRCRVYTRDGCFLGVLDYNAESDKWHPIKVFATKTNE